MGEDSWSIDAIVETPKGDYNRYRYDHERNAIRLCEVVYGEERYPGEWVVIPKTMAADGGPLRALLVINQPTFPGCVVSMRPIGVVELDSDESLTPIVVGVSGDDSHFSQVSTIGDLPAPRLRQIESFLDGHRSDTGKSGLKWLPAQVARQTVQAALQSARLAEAALRAAQPIKPAWKAVFNPRSDEQPSAETRADTQAEQALYGVPYRFQRYVEECILEEERLLCLIARPPSGHGLLSFVRQRHNEGILIITDQQLLFMSDALPPDATYVHWGYIAKAIALERLKAAAVVQSPPFVQLHVEVAALHGSESFALSFPKEAASDLERAVSILRGFIPSAEKMYLQRTPRYADELPSLNREEDRRRIEISERLEALVRERLPDNDYIVARALAPAWPPSKLPARLLALSWTALFVATDAQSSIDIYDLREISSVEIRHSLLGCYLEVCAPRNGELRKLHVEFDNLSGRSFTRLFVAIRQLLVTPLGHLVAIEA